jgi:hypothetical protein
LRGAAKAEAVESIMNMLLKTSPAIWKDNQKDAFLLLYNDESLVAGSAAAQKLFESLGLKKSNPVSSWQSNDEIPF